MPMTRALLLAIVAGFAQAFVPGQVPGGRHWAKLRRSTCGGTALLAQKLPQRRGSYSLRMSEEPSDKEMEELLQKRVQLLKEKEELLQERKSIVSEGKDGPVPEVQRPNMSANMASSKRAEDLINSANGNIFQVFGRPLRGDRPFPSSFFATVEQAIASHCSHC